jgi:hypothetical protein
MTITELDLVMMIIPSFLGAFMALTIKDYVNRNYDDN